MYFLIIPINYQKKKVNNKIFKNEDFGLIRFKNSKLVRLKRQIRFEFECFY